MLDCLLLAGINYTSYMADVAQLAEHLVVAQVAVGSNPIIRPIFRSKGRICSGLWFFLSSLPLF